MKSLILESFDSTLNPYYYLLRQKLKDKQIPFRTIPRFVRGKKPVKIVVPTTHFQEAQREYLDLQKMFAEEKGLFECYENALETGYLTPIISRASWSVLLLVSTGTILSILIFLLISWNKNPERYENASNWQLFSSSSFEK